MQYQHYVNMRTLWPRARDVLVKGEKMTCVLDYQHAYDLVESYKLAPHAQFLNLKSDRDLTKFVRSFGPLVLCNGQTFRGGHNFGDGDDHEASTAAYWCFRDWLKGLSKLIKAMRAAKGVREALLRYVEATSNAASYGTSEQYETLCYFHPLYHAGISRLEGWIADGNETQIREFAAFAIEQSLMVEAGIEVTSNSRSPEVSARFKVYTLQKALQWMFWHDEFRRRPLVFCEECNTAFRPPDAHERKFCSYECAHRVAARKWRRKDLARKKGPRGSNNRGKRGQR